MTLRLGSSGEPVKELQKILGLTPDGSFGPMTEKAVKEYQSKNGLKVDGIVGESTLSAMKINTSIYGKIYNGDELLKRVKELSDFNGVPNEYWLIGVRNPVDHPDQFDDMFYLMKGESLVMKTTGTTNPGLSILKGFKKYNKEGAAILESDRWYHGVWKYGMHNGYMPALRQVGNKVTVWRDGDMDYKSEEQGKKETGWFGINFHTATKSYLGNIIKSTIGGWSAGCQVCNNTKEYMEIINTIKNSKQDKVTYCLLKEF